MIMRIFKVQGRGGFPFDMLRYDECWPETTNDALMLQHPDTLEGLKAVRTITMATASRNAPNAKRWESFLWRVVP